MPYQILRPLFQAHIKRKIRFISGQEKLPRPPFIIVGNHIGYLDPIALVVFIYEIYQRPLYFLTSQFMWRVWGGPLASRWLAMIPVHQKRRADSLEEAVSYLKRGGIVGIFPEGARNRDKKKLLPGKTGAVRLSLQSGAPLIPVGIQNTTGHGFLTVFSSLWQKDKSISFTFGQAVELDEFRHQPINKPLLHAATKKLMLVISKLCGKSYPY